MQNAGDRSEKWLESSSETRCKEWNHEIGSRDELLRRGLSGTVIEETQRSEISWNSPVSLDDQRFGMGFIAFPSH